MTTVLHVIDANCDETQLQILDLIRTRPSEGGHAHLLCSIDGPMAARAGRFLKCEVSRAEQRLAAPVKWSPRLSAVGRETGAGLVHAWGIDAAIECSAGLSALPIIVTLLKPDVATGAARWLRAFPKDAAVVVGSQAARTRLLAAGVSPERVVVIRGPVDFGAINRARRAGLRRALVGEDGPVVLTLGPPSSSGGQRQAVWASAVVKQIHRGLRLLLPYESSEARRIRQWVADIDMPTLLVVPDPRLTWADLTACADVFLVPAQDEVPTESVAWAMAAGCVIIGTAIRSVAELIADRQNGLLHKPSEPRRLADQLLRAIEDEELGRRLTDAARAQAFEAFGARDFLDNYERLYANVLAGKAPGEGVRDTLMAA